MAGLLSYAEALSIMRNRLHGDVGVERCSLAESANRALAEQILATEPNPRFDNSAVDGYAIGSELDAREGTLLDVYGSVAAGESSGTDIQPGKALRILTGAPVPERAFAVVMQEDTERDGSRIKIGSQVPAGANIRRQGTDFQAGTTLMEIGRRLNPGSVALLASQGMSEVTVFRRPKVGILVTGDELAAPEKALSPGMIRDSNSPMLTALAEGPGAQVTSKQVGDTLPAVTDALRLLSETSDLIVVSGGASVGDRDYIAAAVAELGDIHFHGVAIRPGKPVLFGHVGSVPLFGLPGNPGAAFVCFHIFVREALLRLGGYARPEPVWIDVPFRAQLEPCRREDFVRTRLRDGVAEPVEHQGSFGLRSLADCECLVHIPAGEASSGQAVRQSLILGPV